MCCERLSRGSEDGGSFFAKDNTTNAANRVVDDGRESTRQFLELLAVQQANRTRPRLEHVRPVGGGAQSQRRHDAHARHDDARQIRQEHAVH